MWISYFPGAIKPYQSIRRRGAAAESFLVIAFYRIATGRDCGPARASSSSCLLATRASGERAQQVGREIYGRSYLYIVPRFATRAGHLSDVMARDRTAIGRRSDGARTPNGNYGSGAEPISQRRFRTRAELSEPTRS